ncbi:VOC family protein [soil metagenome]
MFNEISVHPTLPASDMNRARKWYAEKLDLRPTDEDSGGIWYETGSDSRFYLYPSETAGTNKATAMSFQVGDQFDDAVAFIRDRDMELLEFDFQDMSTEDGILTAPDGMKGAWFEDSEGNILAIANQ